MAISQVIFDLDGTLLDTREGILESVVYAAEILGYPQLPEETLLKFVGPPIQESFMTYYGTDRETAQRAADIFRNYYKSSALLKAKAYEGIYCVCRELKAAGIKMAVATYKREDYALILLNHFGFGAYCDPMHGADDRNLLKKADIVNMCISQMGGSREQTVLVGDTVHDAAGAEQAGIFFLAVTYGFGFGDREAACKYPCIGVAASPKDIGRIILGERNMK